MPSPDNAPSTEEIRVLINDTRELAKRLERLAEWMENERSAGR